LLAQAAGLEGERLGEFLRERGVHLEELQQWRKQAEEALSSPSRRLAPSKELRDLKAELARKEKALAEAAALLILKKKADLFWGVEGEDME
jgi:transposase-like protein